LFLLVWSSCFDDYPQLSWVLAGVTDSLAAVRLFDTLGWALSRKEQKRLPLSQRFDVWGVYVDLSNAPEGMLKVTNKIDKLDDMEDEFCKASAPTLTPTALAAKFRGRLSLAEGQVFARTAALMMPAFRARASGRDSHFVMTSTIERDSSSAPPSTGQLCLGVLSQVSPGNHYDLQGRLT
jgi:hypothetical protein